MHRVTRLLRASLPAAALVALLLPGCDGEQREIVLATTTSTENSGLLDVLLPRFEEQSDYTVRLVAVGSGAALRLGERGDVDVILAHAPEAEIAFMEAGHGIARTRVMHNDFIVVGPSADPARIARLRNAAEAFRRIHEAGSPFVSRSDESGTHQMERALWAAAGLEVPIAQRWYSETGQGMGETLTIATEREAYTLTDRATWLEVADPARLALLVEGDERLLNVYHAIVVNPERHAVNHEGAEAFRAFLVQPQTQRLIGEYGVDRYGEPLFVPDAEAGVTR